MQTTAPCKDCPDRHVTEDYNCHMVCAKYLEYQESRRAVQKANEIKNRLDSHKKEFSARYLRYQHKKKI